MGKLERFEKMRTELEAEKAAQLKSLEPLYAKRDALLAKVQPLDAELRELQKHIKVGEEPLRATGGELAALARLLGAKSMTLDAVEVKTEVKDPQ